MSERATTLFIVLLGLLLPLQATAQDYEHVSIRDIQYVAQEDLSALAEAGLDLEREAMLDTLESSITDTVRFTAVMLTDPYLSGLRNPEPFGDNGDVFIPIHAFVRDTASVSQGYEGMSIMVVGDGETSNFGMTSLLVGDVVTFTGVASYFRGGIQFELVEDVINLGPYHQAFGLPDEIIEPITVTVEEIQEQLATEGNASVVQANWDNYNLMINQYVRIEGVTVVAGSNNDTGYSQMLVAPTQGAETGLQLDLRYSVRYNNSCQDGSCSTEDQYDYPDDFPIREEPFRPEDLINARINLQGFLNFGSTFENFSDIVTAEPPGSWFQLLPYADADIEVLGPSISGLTRPDFVPDTDDIVTVTADVAASGADVDDVVLEYTTSATTETETLQPTSVDGTTYTFEISGAEDGAFVTYLVQATDLDGGVTRSAEQSYRVLGGDGITQISHIQQTADDGTGPSPFAGITTDRINLTATINNDPSASSLIVLQDDNAAWSGIFVAPNDDLLDSLAQGDQVTITSATIEENFDLTRLTDLTLTKTETSETHGYAPVPSTEFLQMNAEAYEGVMIRLEDLVITAPNADEPNDYGEFLFASSSTSSVSVRGDVESSSVPDTLNNALTEAQELDFIQGIWSFAFSNFKLWPETMDDIDVDLGTAVEDVETIGGLTLMANYPNPFNPVTTIGYQLDRPVDVRLEVFDVLGRRVATLVETLKPAGTYEATFDARSLSSGLYFYRLEADGHVLTRTMTLVK